MTLRGTGLPCTYAYGGGAVGVDMESLLCTVVNSSHVCADGRVVLLLTSSTPGIVQDVTFAVWTAYALQTLPAAEAAVRPARPDNDAPFRLVLAAVGATEACNHDSRELRARTPRTHATTARLPCHDRTHARVHL